VSKQSLIVAFTLVLEHSVYDHCSQLRIEILLQLAVKVVTSTMVKLNLKPRYFSVMHQVSF
jgi:hypothetical protein